MKFKFPKINTRKVFSYLLLLVITSVIVFLTFASLPLTEKYVKTFNSNMVLNDNSQWTKTYKVELSFEPTQLVNKWALINETKNIVYRRLSRYGAEFVRMEYKEIDQNKGNLLITVKSSKKDTDIQGLITPAGNIKIVIKKDDAKFDDEKKPYAAYEPDNYNDSSLSRKDFRTVYITQLKTTGGDSAYFGIFKPWIWNESKFRKFIDENGGKSGGVNLDGFVTPMTIPVSNGTGKGSPQAILSVVISTTASTANLADIIYNSGEIPVGYTYKDETNLTESNKINYDVYRTFLVLTISLAIGILIASNIFGLNFLETSLTFGLSSIILIAFLKFTQTPITSISLLLSLPLGFIYLIIYEKSKSFIAPLIIGLILFAFTIPARTLFVTFAPFVLYFVMSVPILSWLVKRYIQLFKVTFK